ncbi:MAG TPA: type II secretion system protein [Candidatus Saccharimonadales bacterium]|nr:type II secretion system protein [Candidatus Saccharimonadales bacterium]
MKKTANARGFSIIEALVVLIIIAALGITGWSVWHHKSTDDSQSKVINNGGHALSKNDPYAGWRTSCDPELKACFRYPANWTPSYGGFQNAHGTAYFQYQNPDIKDQGTSEAYIASITDLNTGGSGLKIVGYVVNSNPLYSIFDKSYVDTRNLSVGQTAQIISTNPTFTGRTGKENVTFVATPGINGSIAITSMDMAKEWFNGLEAKTCLKILQSFYYE